MTSRPYVCGLEAALDVVGGKWKTMILWHLNLEPRRFGQLKRLLDGISEKMLIQQLRQLEADGVIHREVYPEVPPRVDYSLTKFGKTLIEALEPLCDWGAQHQSRIEATHRPDAGEHGGSFSPSLDNSLPLDSPARDG